MLLIAGISIHWHDRGIEERFLTASTAAFGKVLVKSRSGSSPETYHVTYLYLLPSGQKRYGSARLALPQWEALTELGPIPLRYLTAEDDRSKVSGSIEHTILGPAFAACGAILTFIGLYLVLRR